jgi:hypothetical protein
VCAGSERFLGLESFVELVAFCDQSVGIFCPRRSAPEAKHRTKQPESAKEMIRIHEGKLVRAPLRFALVTILVAKSPSKADYHLKTVMHLLVQRPLIRRRRTHERRDLSSLCGLRFRRVFAHNASTSFGMRRRK